MPFKSDFYKSENAPYFLSQLDVPANAGTLAPAVRVPLVGGNCHNGSNCGARYLNCNNDASNYNWNIGASVSH